MGNDLQVATAGSVGDRQIQHRTRCPRRDPAPPGDLHSHPTSGRHRVPCRANTTAGVQQPHRRHDGVVRAGDQLDGGLDDQRGELGGVSGCPLQMGSEIRDAVGDPVPREGGAVTRVCIEKSMRLARRVSHWR